MKAKFRGKVINRGKVMFSDIFATEKEARKAVVANRKSYHEQMIVERIKEG